MHRLANSHFTDLRTYFDDRIEPGVLRRTDFDLLQDRYLLAEITRFTPLGIQAAIDLTIQNNRLTPFTTLANRNFVPWLLPPPRKRPQSFGLQICPSCWSKESIPYHRIQWRLSLFFFCIKCGVYLLDHCPSCNHPIVHVQTNYLKLVEDPLNIQRFCYHCKWDLSRSEQVTLSKEDSETADRVSKLFEHKQQLPCSLEDYLVVLHFFTQRAFSDYQRLTNRQYPIQRGDRSRFLEINSITRAGLLAKAFEMFDSFPEIVLMTKRNHLSVKSFWLRGFVDPPDWYTYSLNI